VLAAGAGTRLRPLTDRTPKALCPVGGVPLVDLALRHLEPITPHLAVNVHAHRDQMVEHFAARPGIHLSIEGPIALGTAGALGQLKPWIDGRDVIVHNADAWHRADLRALVTDGWDGERMRLLVVPVAGGEEPDFDGRWRYAGVSALPWREVATLRAEPSGLYEVLWRDADDLDFVAYDGPWFDTGTPATYEAANLAARR
jgi:NDP-sugar pyrophosphorylase family protein